MTLDDSANFEVRTAVVRLTHHPSIHEIQASHTVLRTNEEKNMKTRNIPRKSVVISEVPLQIEEPRYRWMDGEPQT